MPSESVLLRCLQVARETWSLNGASYGAYRAFVAHAKEHGFPDVALAQLTQQLAQRGASDGAAERVEQSSGSAAASVGGLAGQSAPAYGFAGTLLSCYMSGTGEYLWSCKATCIREGRKRPAIASWRTQQVLVPDMFRPAHLRAMSARSSCTPLCAVSAQAGSSLHGTA